MVNLLLVYERPTGTLLREVPFDDEFEALHERFRVEKEFAGNDDIEVVVLSAPSREVMLETHARYFLKEIFAEERRREEQALAAQQRP